MESTNEPVLQGTYGSHVGTLQNKNHGPRIQRKLYSALGFCFLNFSRGGDLALFSAFNLAFWWSIVHPSNWFPFLSSEVTRISLTSSNFFSRTSA